jgi:hypothetical protein
MYDHMGWGGVIFFAICGAGAAFLLVYLVYKCGFLVKW